MVQVSVFHIGLTISNRRALDIRDGNSGSWVVDTLSYEVYGHLVVSDAFREGYVIPLAMKMMVEMLKKPLISQRTLVLRNRARSKRYQRHQERNATLHLFTTIGMPKGRLYNWEGTTVMGRRDLETRSVESLLVVYLCVSSLSLIDAQKTVAVPIRG
jgi:hypothetical protein